MTVESVAGTQVALTQARVQTALAARLLEMTREMGGPRQTLELVRQAAETAAATANRAAAGGLEHLDLYA